MNPLTSEELIQLCQLLDSVPYNGLAAARRFMAIQEKLAWMARNAADSRNGAEDSMRVLHPDGVGP